MWTLSGFADEVSADLDEQCRVFNELGIRFVEFRGAWDTNVLDLDDDQLNRAAKTLAAHGLRTSSIGSPIGKTGIYGNTPQRCLVVAGEGDGQVRETIRALHADGFDGFFSLEPHLSAAGPLGGFSGAELFATAHAAFTRLLDDEGIAYR